MSDGLKKWLPWVLAGVMALILAFMIGANLGDDDVDALDTTTTGQVTTSSVAETTTSEVPDTTTTAVPVTTTTTPSDTTTTTVAPVTTTTNAVTAVVELSDEGIQAGDIWVHFGYDDEDAIAAVSAILGLPTIDSGWGEDPICPAPVVRTVRWDDFWMLFTQADTDFESAGVPHFFTFFYSGSTPELYTTEGIGIGSSVEMLEAAYGGATYTMEESPWVASEGYWTYDLQDWTGLWGYSTGQLGAHVVIAINGGEGCGEG